MRNGVKDHFRCCWWNYLGRHYSFNMLDLVKKIVKNPFHDVVIFSICLILYGLNEFFLKNFNTSLQFFFTGYFNDILAPIFLLSYSNILLKIFLKKFCLNFIVLSLFILLVGCFWEFITPLYKKSTTDPFDVLTYYVGFLLYWFFRQFLFKNRSVKG